MSRQYIYLFVFFICTFFSCLSEDKSRSETDFVNESNFKDLRRKLFFEGDFFWANKKTVKVNDIFYTATILPNHYYIKKHLKQKDSLKFYINKLSNEKVIQFDFQHVTNRELFTNSNNRTYEDFVKKISFTIQNNFYIVANKKDTIRANGAFFERAFKVTPYKRVLLYFDLSNNNSNSIKLVYDDQVFGNGIIKLNLNQ